MCTYCIRIDTGNELQHILACAAWNNIMPQLLLNYDYYDYVHFRHMRTIYIWMCDH